jgi:hypothetical protein
MTWQDIIGLNSETNNPADTNSTTRGGKHESRGGVTRGRNGLQKSARERLKMMDFASQTENIGTEHTREGNQHSAFGTQFATQPTKKPLATPRVGKNSSGDAQEVLALILERVGAFQKTFLERYPSYPNWVGLGAAVLMDAHKKAQDVEYDALELSRETGKTFYKMTYADSVGQALSAAWVDHRFAEIQAQKTPEQRAEDAIYWHAWYLQKAEPNFGIPQHWKRESQHYHCQHPDGLPRKHIQHRAWLEGVRAEDSPNIPDPWLDYVPQDKATNAS